MGIKLMVATSRRRAFAGLVDGLSCLLIAALPYLIGLTRLEFITPVEDRFILDNLLVMLAELPMTYVTPFTWATQVFVFWHFCFLYFNRGATPGGIIAGVKAVDRHGDPLVLRGAALRAFGQGLCALSLGLGWLWTCVSSERRSFADILSRSYTVRR